MTNTSLCSLLQSERGVTAIIGFILVVSVVLALSAVLLMGNIPFVNNEPIDEPLTFESNITSGSDVGIMYVRGADLTPENTQEIRVVNENTSSNVTLHEDELPVLPGEHLIAPGENPDLVKTGAVISIIRVNTQGDSEIVDTLNIPTTDQLGTTDRRDVGIEFNGTIDADTTT